MNCFLLPIEDNLSIKEENRLECNRGGIIDRIPYILSHYALGILKKFKPFFLF